MTATISRPGQRKKSKRTSSRKSKKSVDAPSANGKGLTTTRHNTDDAGAQNVGYEIGEVIQVPVGEILPHPDNRPPTPARIAKVKQSIAAQGQLEAATIRMTFRGDDATWEMLSGETRWLAIQELGGATIDCRVAHNCSDADALRILAAANAARDDLNPIERAELMAKLLEADGGAMTTEQVGKMFSLSRSAVANCLRLAKLPHPIARLVIDGRLPETFARSILTLLDGPAAAVAVRVVLKIANKRKDAVSEHFTREDFTDEVADQLRGLSRSMQPADKWDRSSEYRLRDPTGQYSTCYFKPTPAQLEELAVFTVPGSRKAERASNIRLWDKLNKEAADKILARINKSASKSNSIKAGATEANQKEKRAQDNRLLKRKIRNWRHRWVRSLIAEYVSPKKLESGISEEAFLVVARLFGYLMARGGGRFQSFKFSDLNFSGGSFDQWQPWSTMEYPETAEACAMMAHLMLTTGEHKDGWHPLEDDVIDSLAAFLGIDLQRAWQALGNDETSRFHGFLQLHNKWQVEALCRELKVQVGSARTRKQTIANCLEQAKLVSLPKSIAPLNKAKRRVKKKPSRRKR